MGRRPLLIDDKELGKLARKLKKEKVNVDIICFGEEVTVLCFKNCIVS